MVPLEQNWKNFLEKDDESSFSVIYNKYVVDLFAYGISLGFHRENCKDAIQDVFIKIYLSKNNISKIENKTGYIFRSFKNRLIDLEKKNSGKDNINSFDDKFTLEATVLDNIIDVETAAILKKKVNRLLENITPNQREAVYLKHVVGLNHKEIADILNIQEESARKLLYRAMEKLRESVSDDDISFLVLCAGLINFFI